MLFMPKAVKIQLYQESANYMIPHMYKNRLTYPLPPYSTVSGMIHALSGFTSYHPMKLSIQGTTGATYTDYAIRYETMPNVKKTEDALTRYTARLESTKDNPGYYRMGIVRGTYKIQLVTNLNLTLHVVPDDPKDLDIIYDAFKHPNKFPSLGRYEDLVEIQNVSLTDIHQEYLDEDQTINTSAYIPQSYINSDDLDLDDNPSMQSGTYYNLSHHYDLAPLNKKKTKTYRHWHTVRSLYKNSYQLLEDDQVNVDNDGQVVWLG